MRDDTPDQEDRLASDHPSVLPARFRRRWCNAPRIRFSWTIVLSCVAGTMPITHNIDIKLSFDNFEQFDMTPGIKGRQFRRNLLLHGGRSDAHGFSYADCFLRIDAHDTSSELNTTPCTERGPTW